MSRGLDEEVEEMEMARWNGWVDEEIGVDGWERGLYRMSR